MNGAMLLIRTLKQAGVRTVFSLSGNQIMPVYDACLDVGIRIVHVRHESAAVFMADAWAQVTGQIGVALVTAGPGFANALSPLYSARIAESPVLLLSGDAPIAMDGMGAFQEMPQTAISAPLVKAAIRPRSAAAMGTETARAIRTACSGRPGPVHMALPADVLLADAGAAAVPTDAALARIVLPLAPETAEAVTARLAQARRPVILTGPLQNRSRAGERLERLAAALNVPVIPFESPRALRDPSLGAVAEVLGKADLVVSLGKVIDFSAGFARPPALAADCELMVIDPETAALDRAQAVAGPRLILKAQADADGAAEALIQAGGGSRDNAWRADVAEALAFRGGAAEATDKVHPRIFSAGIQRLLDGAADAILVCDGGEIGQWAQAFCSAPTRIINGIAGAIGGGLCYAIAAKIARPQATVLAVMGDGTAGFHFAEFDTAVREGASIVAVIGNDFRWNAEHQIQLREFGADRLIGCALSPTARYDLAAAGFGCHGEHVTEAAGLDGAMDRALHSGRPACVNVEIEGLPAPNFSRNTSAPGSH